MIKTLDSLDKSSIFCFSAHRNNVNQTGILTSFNTKIQFTHTDYNNGEFDITASRFTPKQSGYYLITGSVGTAFTSTVRTFRTCLYKNGGNIHENSIALKSDDWVTATIAYSVYLNGTTDYLELWTVQQTGATQSVTGWTGGTFFQALLVSKC